MIEASLFGDNTTVLRDYMLDLRNVILLIYFKDARQFVLDSRMDDRFLLCDKLIKGF